MLDHAGAATAPPDAFRLVLLLSFVCGLLVVVLGFVMSGGYYFGGPDRRKL